MWMCAAMIAGAVVVVLGTGSLAYLIPALGCMFMMGAMMWMMGGHGGGSDRG